MPFRKETPEVASCLAAAITENEAVLVDGLQKVKNCVSGGWFETSIRAAAGRKANARTANIAGGFNFLILTAWAIYAPLRRI